MVAPHRVLHLTNPVHLERYDRTAARNYEQVQAEELRAAVEQALQLPVYIGPAAAAPAHASLAPPAAEATALPSGLPLYASHVSAAAVAAAQSSIAAHTVSAAAAAQAARQHLSKEARAANKRKRTEKAATGGAAGQSAEGKAGGEGQQRKKGRGGPGTISTCSACQQPRKGTHKKAGCPTHCLKCRKLKADCSCSPVEVQQ